MIYIIDAIPDKWVRIHPGLKNFFLISISISISPQRKICDHTYLYPVSEPTPCGTAKGMFFFKFTLPLDFIGIVFSFPTSLLTQVIIKDVLLNAG